MSNDLFLPDDPFDDPAWQQSLLVADAPRASKGYVACALQWEARVLPLLHPANKQLAVLQLIYRRCRWTHNLTVSLPNSDLVAIGMSRYGKYRALATLERRGLIRREPYDGKTIRVTLLVPLDCT